jgi:hypothetical protein
MPGLGIRISDNFGITLDAKYVPLESSARAVRTAGQPCDSLAGVSLRF